MTSTRTTQAPLLSEAQVAQLVVNPVMTTSAAGRLLTRLPVTGRSLRIPRVLEDPNAGWVAEGDEITIDDPTTDEIVVEPRKIAVISTITNELATDSNPSAANVIGAGLVRDISRKLDAALFAANTTNGPAGLASLTGVQNATAASMDALPNAIVGASYAVEAANGTVTNWVCNPSDAARIANIKRAKDSNEPLLGGSVAEPTARSLFGTPLIVAAACPAGIMWGIDQRTAWCAIWDDATVEADHSVLFTSDRTAIRAKLRVGFAFAHPASIAKVTLP